MLKKTIRRLGALAMVLAMAVSVFAVNASAATGVTAPTITKTITAAENVKTPVVTFEFTIANGTATTLTDGTPVYAGVTNGVKFKSVNANGNGYISFTASDPLTKSAELEFDATKFTRPGIYAYTISEVVPEQGAGYDGMEYSAQAKTLYVYVVNGANGPEVDGCQFLGTSEAEKGNGAFTNAYTTKNLKVIKKITGTQGVQSDTFKFKVTVNGATDEQYTMVIYNTDNDNNPAPVTLTSKQASAEFELSGDQYAMIYGLSPTDTFTVEEINANTANNYGYQTTYDVAEGITAGNAEANGVATVVTNVTMGDKNRTATVRNDKSPSTPGGVIMTIAPYALMLVVAGAFAVVFLSRRNRAE